MEVLKNGTVMFESESELARYCDEQRREKEKHSGWTNYATWRIALEMVDVTGENLSSDGIKFEDVYSLSEYIKEDVEAYLFDNETGSECNLVQSYAEAFVSEVNWYEIAENMVSDSPELIK